MPTLSPVRLETLLFGRKPELCWMVVSNAYVTVASVPIPVIVCVMTQVGDTAFRYLIGLT